MARRRRNLKVVRWIAGTSAEIARETVRPALLAIPSAVCARLGGISVELKGTLEVPDASSRWRLSGNGVLIEVATDECSPHDVAIEALLCAGQALWERITDRELGAWLATLSGEISAAFPGEIDEVPYGLKTALLATTGEPPRRRMLEYARASFAATLAEYVHCLWHDVTVRSGPEHLPVRFLRRRLELLARWFPPDPGYHLFPRRPVRQHSARGTLESE